MWSYYCMHCFKRKRKRVDYSKCKPGYGSSLNDKRIG